MPWWKIPLQLSCKPPLGTGRLLLGLPKLSLLQTKQPFLMRGISAPWPFLWPSSGLTPTHSHLPCAGDPRGGCSTQGRVSQEQNGKKEHSSLPCWPGWVWCSAGQRWLQRHISKGCPAFCPPEPQSPSPQGCSPFSSQSVFLLDLEWRWTLHLTLLNLMMITQAHHSRLSRSLWMAFPSLQQVDCTIQLGVYIELRDIKNNMGVREVFVFKNLLMPAQNCESASWALHGYAFHYQSQIMHFLALFYGSAWTGSFCPCICPWQKIFVWFLVFGVF